MSTSALEKIIESNPEIKAEIKVVADKIPILYGMLSELFDTFNPDQDYSTADVAENLAHLGYRVNNNRAIRTENVTAWIRNGRLGFKQEKNHYLVSGLDIAKMVTESVRLSKDGKADGHYALVFYDRTQPRGFSKGNK